MARHHLLDLPVDDLTLPEVLDAVERAIEADRRITVAYLNVHVANQARRLPDLRAFLEATDICYVDGRGIRLGGRLLGLDLPERMTGADWIWDLAARMAGRHRLYWIGGEPGVTAAAARALRERHPALAVATDHGFHPPEEDDAVLARIHAFRPDVLLVGMGTPVQERWVARLRPRLEVPVVWCLGATADFVAGRVPRGPAWLHTRQEWLARLLAEPRRLWRRYLVGNTAFLLAVGRARLARRPRR